MVRLYCTYFAVLLCLPGLLFGASSDLTKAPPAFALQGGKAVFSDFSYVTTQLRFDVTSRSAKGKSLITFQTEEAGRPLFDFVGTITSARLDGQTLAAIATVSSPNSATQLRVLPQEVAPGEHQLELEFDFPSAQISFSSTGVKVGFFMSDVGEDRAFLERYLPSNLEFDQFAMDTSIELTGANKNHQLFTNGQYYHPSPTQWFISFPSYFTTSSFYLHFTEADLQVAREMFKGTKTEFPITIYSTSASLTRDGMTTTKRVLAELEQTYGPFAHQQVIAYMTSTGGGMEHCGATMTTLEALGHELTHSWFARGVMPSGGNSGWIDEAVASWRDNGYPVGSEPNGPSTNLANFSPYKRDTPNAAYTRGADFLSDLDFLFRAKGGLRAALRELFGRYQRTTITTPLFATEMSNFSAIDLSRYFDKFVYGKTNALFTWEIAPQIPRVRSYHPRPYTEAELRELR